ncbi:molybdopterin-synthase adenylyltransferase MoeB [Flammeovirga yaeyamensis]|uniref:Molybdopterin-synthase adenylyltransferase n=1 Tax=Flammeovirga yaeyamensis TaxID=367791 RepID=A0AAX1N4F8_9BACT|nr:HesA/MoeB/ThiF family protein [Flammeovirga yaeyamensis]MBB3701449.1 adenylyltransferase/sulfurtransferase [Flammeovirga yaeyamensis]NMF38519.1 molybdopterin-synthase adenylyltransferase MoeB [Flammeovirga yaeyamensis]QWG02401.1 molybdopterin-synthase adenylyltransferase MoeB [Flammeovirga yaeyamensis]
MLTKEEYKRYDRHIRLKEIGVEGQQKLKDATILIIGAGGLGCPVSQYLAAAGVGHIILVDHDEVSISNLQRQIMFTTEDVGKPKAEVIQKRLNAMNPHVKVTTILKQFNKENALEIIALADIVVDGTDNFSSRYLINDACVIQNKPLVSASIQGFDGQLSVFNYQDGPTYRCIFPNPPSAEEAPNCNEIGVVGAMVGVLGTMQATEVVKLITNVGKCLSGELLLINGLNMSFQTLRFKKNPKVANISTLGDYNFDFCAVPDDDIEITYSQLEELLTEEGTVLVDVRETYEREIDDIGGIHIPLADLEDSIDEIPTAKNVVFYCQSGKRSMMAVDIFKENALNSPNIFSLKGGMELL